MKKFIILTIFISIFSCKGQGQEKEESRMKAKELVKQANELLIKSKLEEPIKLDSCLTLINEAIKIDENYFNAYYTKITFLALKKDIKESINNNEKMIQLRPNQPLWKIQRGLFFDIDGNSIEANKYYAVGIKEYEDLFKKTELKNDFNLRMEYISALEAKGDIKKAEKELEKINLDFPNNEILKAYTTDYKFKTKEQLIEVWNKGKDN